MFENVQSAPADPILGLTETFNADANPNKINLSVGVYKDASGQTPVLNVVKEAEARLLDTETNKSYKPITGDPVYGKAVRKMIFGEGSELIDSGRAVTAHCPGGTGALRVVGDYLKKLHSSATLWLSDPTWPNHPKIFEAAGVAMKSYPYFDAEKNAVDFDALLAALTQIPAGDAVLLHGCCHNPTGADPTPEQWEQIGDVLVERGVLPIVDFAYQGFADGIESDAVGLRILVNKMDEIIVCSSFSKNFGLYCERVGALTFVAKTPEAAAAVFSQVKICIRTNYSNPPAHGGAIVSTVLGDDELYSQWEIEVAEMRDRINAMRKMFVESLKAKGVERDFSFIVDQRGMFSFSGLTKEQVQKLRDEYSIYIVGSGRINVAGMTDQNMDRLTDAIAKVL